MVPLASEGFSTVRYIYRSIHIHIYIIYHIYIYTVYISEGFLRTLWLSVV